MSLDEFIHTKQEQLRHLEEKIEERAHTAGDKVTAQLDAFRTKRDDFVTRLQALRGETAERVTVMRMGIESAWTELETAFKMATGDLPRHGS